MKTYSVCLRHADDRVVLLEGEPPLKHEVMQVIEAETWIDARMKVNETGIYNNPGYGWFKR